MAIKTTLVQGKARWCKVLGAAPPGYDNGPNEWTFDLVLDDKGVKDFLSSGADKFYLREDKTTGESFVKFSRKAVKQDGTEAKPIRVIDHRNDEWNQSELIGNGSTVNVQFTLNEVKSKGQKRMKPSILAMQVWDHQKYKPKSSFPVKETVMEDVSTDVTNTKEW